MLYHHQAIIEGLAYQGITVSSPCRNHRSEGWQVTAIDGQPVTNLCCRFFDRTEQEEANREYTVTKQAYQRDPFHFIDGLQESVRFMVQDETGEHPHTALLMKKVCSCPSGIVPRRLPFICSLWQKSLKPCKHYTEWVVCTQISAPITSFCKTDITV